MIRQPSPGSQLYAWHSAAIAGHDVDRHDDDPQCGWFKMKLVKGGPWVPVEIRVEREIDDESGELTGPETFVALVDGERRKPGPIWTHLTAITRADFLALKDRKATIAGMEATRAKFDLTEGPILP